MNIEQPWKKVRGWFNWPSLAPPKLKDKLKGGAHFDFGDNTISIGRDFVNEVVTETDLSERECLESLLTHEVGHFMVFPKTLGTIILSAKMITDLFKEKSDNHKNFIFQTYADMTNDVKSVLDPNRREAILNMRKASQKTLPDKVNANIRKVMLEYLKFQAGEHYSLDEELQPYFDRMKEIDFLNRDTGRLRLGLFQWGEIVNDMIKEYAGTMPIGMPSDIDIDDILESMSDKEKRKALRELSKELTRREYKQVREWLKDKGVSLPKGGKGFTLIGTSRGELPVDLEVLDYYKELSKMYPLIVHKKPIETKKRETTFEDIEKWRPGIDPTLALPALSGGKYLPGITKSIKKTSRPVHSLDYETPHLLVVIDSSGSMPDPEKEKSYAVLAAYCAARSYHAQGASIGVINFSGKSFYLPYTRDLDHALAAIAMYQGGGTDVDMDMLRKMLGPERARLYENMADRDLRSLPREAVKKDIELSVPAFEQALDKGFIDLLMFTDGGIGNLDEVLEFMGEHGAPHRGTIVLSDSYVQDVGEYEGVNIHRVKEDEDIPKIVMKDVKGHLSYGKAA